MCLFFATIYQERRQRHGNKSFLSKLYRTDEGKVLDVRRNRSRRRGSIVTFLNGSVEYW